MKTISIVGSLFLGGSLILALIYLFKERPLESLKGASIHTMLIYATLLISSILIFIGHYQLTHFKDLKSIVMIIFFILGLLFMFLGAQDIINYRLVLYFGYFITISVLISILVIDVE